MSFTDKYRALSAKERGRLASVGAKAAFLVSEREPKWRRDASTREYWSQRYRAVLERLGLDEEVDLLARAAFDQFGYVADWESSPKTRDAWIRRTRAALEAIRQDLGIQGVEACGLEGANARSR